MADSAAMSATACDAASFQVSRLPIEYNDTKMPMGVLRLDSAQPVDAVMENVARKVQRNGTKLVGYLQRETAIPGNCCSRIYLENVNSAAQYSISQSLGPGSKGCRLDPQGLADAAGHILTEVENAAELLILNRFGKGEAEGGGFRSVIEAALLRDIPVLIAAREPYLEDLRLFADGLFDCLPPGEQIVLDWCRRVLKAPKSEALPVSSQIEAR